MPTTELPDPIPTPRPTPRPTPLRRARVHVALAILIPLAVGALLRVIGLRHGAPTHIFHPDVAKQAYVAVDVFTGELDIRRRYRDDVERTLYPYGTAVLAGYAMRLYHAVTGPPERLGPLWRWDFRLRLVAVVTMLAAAAYVAAAHLGRWGPGLAGLVAVLLLVEPVNTLQSHYGMNDVPLTAMLLVAWTAAARMPGDRRFPGHALLAGLALGVGFGIKYQAVLGAVFPAAALGVLLARGDRRSVLAGAAAAALGVAAGALLSVPLLTSDPIYFIKSMPAFLAWQTDILGEGRTWREKGPLNARQILTIFGASGRVVLLIAPLWWLVRLARRRLPGAGEALPAASAVAFVALYLAAALPQRDMIRPWDLLPVFAMLTVLLGCLLRDWRGAPHVPATPRYVLAWILLSALAVHQSGVALRDSLALRRPDTRVQAQTWLREALPPGAVVLRERYTLPVRRADILERECRHLADDKIEGLVRGGAFDVLIASSLAHRRFFDPYSPRHSPERQAVYRYAHDTYPLVAIFEDRPLQFNNPKIIIYANPHRPAGAALLELTGKR